MSILYIFVGIHVHTNNHCVIATVTVNNNTIVIIITILYTYNLKTSYNEVFLGRSCIIVHIIIMMKKMKEDKI